MLIKSKEEIAWAAYDAAKRVMQDHVATGGYGYTQSTNSIMGQLTDLIALAVQAGVATALNNMYTNEEFEQDLTLEP